MKKYNATTKETFAISKAKLTAKVCWVWVRHCKKTIQKIQESCIGSGTSHFKWLKQRESRTVSSVNK